MLMVQRLDSTASAIDVLEHVLDNGIVVDAWIRVSVAAIDLVTMAARIVVASSATYVDVLSMARPGRPNAVAAPDRGRSLGEQLRRVGERIDGRSVEPSAGRRAEDLLRDQLHDRCARTLNGD
jgi:hypothetical protein